MKPAYVSLVALSLCLLGGAIAACGDDDDDDDGSSGSSGSSGAGGSNGASGAGQAGAAGGQSGAAGQGSAGGSGLPAAPIGAACGAMTGFDCGDAGYCDYPRDTCGLADETGVCKARPVGCTKEYMPVCSCNGVFSNECTANAAGYDVNAAGQCAPPANPPAVQRR